MITSLSNPKSWHSQINYAANLQQTSLIGGKDPGAGYGKGIYGDMTIVLPSAYSQLRNPNVRHYQTISEDGAWVHYINGSREDLINTQWFWGTAAMAQLNYIPLYEDKAKKAIFSLESILVATWNYNRLDLKSSLFPTRISCNYKLT